MSTNDRICPICGGPKSPRAKTCRRCMNKRQIDDRYRAWRKAVLEADHYTCQHKHYNDDGTEFWFHDPTGRALQAHHIYPWRRNPHLRFDPQNGICLCRRHHQEFHDRYGKFGNTWPQLKKYLES